MAKTVVSIIQLLFACSTLYKTKGDQIELFGYAAFGLTVIMYAWMSLLNLVGTLICPQYPSCFLVESQTFRDLRARFESEDKTFIFNSAVGAIDKDTETLLKSVKPHPKDASLRESYHLFGNPNIKMGVPPALTGHQLITQIVVYHLMPFFVAPLVPIAVIASLSHFAPNSSTWYQRFWTMVWLVESSIGGLLLVKLQSIIVRKRSQGSVAQGENYLNMGLSEILWLIAACTYCIPAIGGFVVVGQMILQYGVCEVI